MYNDDFWTVWVRSPESEWRIVEAFPTKEEAHATATNLSKVISRLTAISRARLTGYPDFIGGEK